MPGRVDLIMERSKIIAILSKIAREKTDNILGHLSLGSIGINSSFGLSALRSKLQSEGKVTLPPFNLNMKVDDLIKLLDGENNNLNELIDQAIELKSRVSEEPLRTPYSSAPLIPRNLGIGMDMQEIDLLPLADDFRTHGFYSSHFSPAEIATAMLKPSPRASLCGIFCAKEALKKSHADLLNMNMDKIDSMGRPIVNMASFHLSTNRFQFIMSITHTAQFAAATCITLWSDD